MPFWLWWISIGVGAAGLALLVWSLRGDPARGRRRCPKCWYDMAGAASLTCPECGRTAWSERALRKTRRRRWWAALGAIGLLSAPAIVCGHLLARDGWKAVPRPLVLAAAGWMSLNPSSATKSYLDAFAPSAQQPLPAWQQHILEWAMLRRLHDKDPAQRAIAAEYIQGSYLKKNHVLRDCLPDLIGLMRDPNPTVSSSACYATTAVSECDPRLFDMWAELLIRHPNPEVRATCANVLGELAAQGDQRAILPLLRAQIDPSEQVVTQAVYSLGKSRSPAALPALILAACNPVGGVQGAACVSLGKLDGLAAPATPVLIDLIRKRALRIVWVTTAVGRIGPPAREAVPVLLDELNDPSVRTGARSEAAIALGRIGDRSPEVMSAVRAALDDPKLRSGALEGLFRLGWTPQDADRAMIESCASGSDPAESIWARLILARARGTLDSEVDHLIPMVNLDGQKIWVSEEAINALQSLGARAAPALPVLERLANPPDQLWISSDDDTKQQAAEPAVRHIKAEIAAQAIER